MAHLTAPKRTTQRGIVTDGNRDRGLGYRWHPVCSCPQTSGSDR